MLRNCRSEELEPIATNSQARIQLWKHSCNLQALILSGTLNLTNYGRLWLAFMAYLSPPDQQIQACTYSF